MLFVLVIIALAAFAGAMFSYAAGLVTTVPVHLALACGAMPLISGAILHFVPVLTRSTPREHWLLSLPWLMLLAGILAVTSFLFPVTMVAGRDAAALLGIAGVAILTGWIVHLSRKSLGGPHPGVHWYLAALLCLLFGLTTVLLMHIWPGQYLALRRFHLHLNTLGFIGITAIGTLQVLLPTALGQPDLQVAQRLRTDLKWVFAGTLLIAAGAAWSRPLVWPGLLLWLVPLLRLAAAWVALYRKAPMKWSGTATVIAGALLGFMVVLAMGAAHASGALPVPHASIAYILAFLLPLVTGAASYLLPLWIRPGMQTEWHLRTRQSLARFGIARVALFIAAGVTTALSGSNWALFPAFVGFMLFGAQLRALRYR